MAQDRFTDMIVDHTGLDRSTVEQVIAEDLAYPEGRRFEEGLADIMGNFVRYGAALDRAAEENPMDMGQMMDTAAKAMEESGMTEDQLFVAQVFYQAVNGVLCNSLDSARMMPVKVEDEGEGLLKIYFAKINGTYDQLMSSPQKTLNDFVENTPEKVLFLDTTPGKPGFRVFLADFKP